METNNVNYDAILNVQKNELSLFHEIVKEFNTQNGCEVAYVNERKDIDELTAIAQGTHVLYIKTGTNMANFWDIHNKLKCKFLKKFNFSLRFNVSNIDKFSKVISEYGKTKGAFVSDMSCCQHIDFSKADSYGLYMTDTVNKDKTFWEIFRRYNLGALGVSTREISDSGFMLSNFPLILNMKF